MHRGNDLGHSRIGFDLLAQLAIDNLKHLVRLDVRLAANELEAAHSRYLPAPPPAACRKKL
jgi:hypothetical protein